MVETSPADLALTLVTASPARRAAAADAFRRAFGAAPPDGPTLVRADGLAALGFGPGRWLLAAPAASGLQARAAAAFGATALVVDQSDARVATRLAGPGLPALTERLSSLDLSPAAFPPGAVAATEMLGISAWLWREADGAIVVAVPASYAESFSRQLGRAIGKLAFA